MAQLIQPHISARTLEADSILLEYKNQKVLQNIYVKIEKGEIIGLLGRNGCGKSSLLEVIYGIRSAQYSCVRIDGNFIDKIYRQRNLVAYLPQKRFAPGHIKVREALNIYQADIPEAIHYFPEIENWFSLRINDLSGGYQRLVETIMVISSPASFIMLDEPFSNLMPLHVETLKNWLKVIKSQKGILITDHYYKDVLEMSDRVYHLNMNGRMIQLQEPQQQLKDLGYIN